MPPPQRTSNALPPQVGDAGCSPAAAHTHLSPRALLTTTPLSSQGAANPACPRGSNAHRGSERWMKPSSCLCTARASTPSALSGSCAVGGGRGGVGQRGTCQPYCEAKNVRHGALFVRPKRQRLECEAGWRGRCMAACNHPAGWRLGAATAPAQAAQCSFASLHSIKRSGGSSSPGLPAPQTCCRRWRQSRPAGAPGSCPGLQPVNQSINQSITGRR